MQKCLYEMKNNLNKDYCIVEYIFVKELIYEILIDSESLGVCNWNFIKIILYHFKLKCTILSKL